jgi:hypothetical protein
MAFACVMGDMDLLQPVAMTGAPCAVVTRLGVPSPYSRFTQSSLEWDDFSQNTEKLLDFQRSIRSRFSVICVMTRRKVASSRAPTPCSASSVILRASVKSSLRSRFALAVA